MKMRFSWAEASDTGVSRSIPLFPVNIRQFIVLSGFDESSSYSDRGV